MSYQILKADHDYEIETKYPFHVRNRETGKVLSVWIGDTGYPCVALKGIPNKLHRLIALQFIPNPHKYKCIDHINRNRRDYHIDNLRWIDYSENNKNRRLWGVIHKRKK